MKTTTFHGDGTKTVSDKPVPTQLDILRTNLILTVNAYDYAIALRAKRNPRVYHNPFALGLYLEAIDRVHASLACEGVTLTQALNENFTGHLLKHLLKKMAPRKDKLTELLALSDFLEDNARIERDTIDQLERA
jgi:hypothetical protein